MQEVGKLLHEGMGVQKHQGLSPKLGIPQAQPLKLGVPQGRPLKVGTPQVNCPKLRTTILDAGPHPSRQPWQRSTLGTFPKSCNSTPSWPPSRAERHCHRDPHQPGFHELDSEPRVPLAAAQGDQCSALGAGCRLRGPAGAALGLRTSTTPICTRFRRPLGDGGVWRCVRSAVPSSECLVATVRSERL